MDHTAADFKELFAWVAVTAVLFDGVFDGLLREAVFQFERGERKPVDEQAEVQGSTGFIGAIRQLTGDAETVLRKKFGCFFVAR